MPPSQRKRSGKQINKAILKLLFGAVCLMVTKIFRFTDMKVGSLDINLVLTLLNRNLQKTT